MVYPLAKLFFPLLRSLFVRNCTGLEHIPKKGPFIIASNHQSHIDGLLIGSSVVEKTNKKIHFLAKKEFTSYFGSAVERIIYEKWASVLFVEEEGTKKRGQHALQQASALLDAGELVGIFPEGKRTYDGSLLEGRTGIVRIVLGAKKAKTIPIIPVGIQNADLMLPRNMMIPRIWKARAVLSFGKPFYLTAYQKKFMTKKTATKKMLRAATTLVMKKIAQLARRSYSYA
ncbi:1-acyl-sn-glycerol-3-phosphate acyltransferase [Candidatus Woesearchaeota archaeon]|nr:1-acyl-sn-glycerol-3-phosphate acyltransferase [Candidatus Woesearchaeota archaeon]